VGPDWSVVLFHSTSSAIRAESLARQAGIEVKLIPVPRQLSSDCGVCLRVVISDTDRVRQVLDGGRVEYDSIYPA
jgi:hypothetical protein